MTYDAAIAEVQRLVGKRVLLEVNGATPTAFAAAAPPEEGRRYEGVLCLDEDLSDDDRCVFTVPTQPRDKRLVNPDGVRIALQRAYHSGAEVLRHRDGEQVLILGQGLLKLSLRRAPGDASGQPPAQL
ncbi:MAG TPA: hypothetical protein VHG69_02490 [Thermoleophilaceae bacterium]|nr:hypothetical protein [Thermoleophilaceae bacterium]